MHAHVYIIVPPASAEAMWMDDRSSKGTLDMTNYKDPTSDFQREVSRIKFNVMRALDAYAEGTAAP